MRPFRRIPFRKRASLRPRAGLLVERDVTLVKGSEFRRYRLERGPRGRCLILNVEHALVTSLVTTHDDAIDQVTASERAIDAHVRNGWRIAADRFQGKA